MTTRRWLTVLLLTMTALVLLGGGAGAAALRHTAAVSNHLADQVAPARTAVGQLDSGLLAQAAAVRGHVVTADPRFLEAYRRGVESERVTMSRLRELLAGEPEALADLDRAQRLADRWRTEFAERLVASRQAGGTPQELAPLVTGDAETFAAVRAELTGLVARLDGIRDAGRDDLDRARALRDLTFVAILAALLLCGIVGSVLVRTRVLRPLDRLGASVRQVAGGDFRHRLRPDGPADIARLTSDVETMRRTVVEAWERSQHDRDALEQQAAELRRSNEDLEQFAYVASHDLQEPLRKVASFCQMLERRYADQLDDRARQYIGFAVDGASRMQELINDLLTFSRIGRVYGELREVDLAEVFAQAESNLSRAVDESGATITRDPLPTVRGEPTLLTMLWQNLLGNAVKFRSPDRAPLIRVTVTDTPQDWSFAVEDNGIGIDPRYAEKIFVIFQRLHPRGTYPGTGIGLAVCKKVVEFHGGTLSLDEAYRDGTRFVFTMPRLPTAVVPAQPGEPATESAAGV
ncbi:ATP-binding protein [Micromonospora sp. DSM 115977]|uniref:histidine kinase n=1 Tax=Micromonospora reichwaldensis TaxID=3075516 RepID=A0ABU2X0M0_9ACTN|nr:ATP-binding protein [Micromonospora sp. DSM 115977]MDT0531677.1 ATP-binding protein [Micromonospora sp. DSM 115977]